METSASIRGKPSRILILWPVLMLTCAAIACVVQQELGEIISEGNPISFTLLGEVDHMWEAEVESGSIYELMVKNVNTNHPIKSVNINIKDVTNDIAGEIVFSDNAATTQFTAPDSGTVTVLIYSNIGERQEDLGILSVELYQIQE